MLICADFHMHAMLKRLSSLDPNMPYFITGALCSRLLLRCCVRCQALSYCGADHLWWTEWQPEEMRPDHPKETYHPHPAGAELLASLGSVLQLPGWLAHQVCQHVHAS